MTARGRYHNPTNSRSVRTITETGCWRSLTYYVRNQRAKGSPAGLIVYTIDPRGDDLYAYFITGDAKHRTTGMELTLRNNVWTYSARLKDGAGLRVSYRTTNRIQGREFLEASRRPEETRFWKSMTVEDDLGAVVRTQTLSVLASTEIFRGAIVCALSSPRATRALGFFLAIPSEIVRGRTAARTLIIGKMQKRAFVPSGGFAKGAASIAREYGCEPCPYANNLIRQRR